MDALFGDATTAMPTPATQAEEHGSLMGAESPASSFDIQRQPGNLGADSAIPGLDINPPNMAQAQDDNSKPVHSVLRDQNDGARGAEGMGGWISSIFGKPKGRGSNARGTQYRRLGQEEAERE